MIIFGFIDANLSCKYRFLPWPKSSIMIFFNLLSSNFCTFSILYFICEMSNLGVAAFSWFFLDLCDYLWRWLVSVCVVEDGCLILLFWGVFLFVCLGFLLMDQSPNPLFCLVAENMEETRKWNFFLRFQIHELLF